MQTFILAQKCGTGICEFWKKFTFSQQTKFVLKTNSEPPQNHPNSLKQTLKYLFEEISGPPRFFNVLCRRLSSNYPFVFHFMSLQTNLKVHSQKRKSDLTFMPCVMFTIELIFITLLKMALKGTYMFNLKLTGLDVAKLQLKSLHFILAQSGNSIIATACPLKSS